MSRVNHVMARKILDKEIKMDKKRLKDPKTSKGDRELLEFRIKALNNALENLP